LPAPRSRSPATSSCSGRRRLLRAGRRRLPLRQRQRNELGLARDRRKALGQPVGLGGADALARRGDEIPRQEAVAERLATDDDDAATARRRQHRRAAGREHGEGELVDLGAVDLDRVVDRVDGALGRVGRRQDDAGAAGDVEIQHQRERRRRGHDRRRSSERRTGDDVGGGAVEPHPRYLVGGDVLERRRGALLIGGQRDPELQAVARVRHAEQVFRRALRMDDAAPGRHPVDGARRDALDHAGRVAMHDRAFEEVGQRRQADVRVRANLVVRAGLHCDRAEVVEEDERADGAAVGLRQQAANREAAAEIADLRREDLQ